MALPTTGGTYPQIFQPGINPLAIRKAIITDAFFRDYLGPSTNLADPSAGLHTDGYFSPYALDGNVRNDLTLIDPTTGSPKTTTNLGFYHAGQLGAAGIGYNPNTAMEEVLTAQSLRPARVDITKEGEEFEIVALEQTPLIRYLANEMPLQNIPDLGQANLTIPRPMEATIVERQFILFGFDGTNNFARTIPRCVKTKEAQFKWAREGKEGTGVTLTFMVLGCPFVNKPVLEHYEGAGWRNLGGYALFPTPAPVATAGPTTKAQITFTQPTGKAAPFTYQVYKTGITPVVPRALATLDVGFPTVSGTTVTEQVTGLTVGNQVAFDIVATGTNQLTTKSLISNTLTVT
jgi:hypothetical protein